MEYDGPNVYGILGNSMMDYDGKSLRKFTTKSMCFNLYALLQARTRKSH